VISTLKEVSRLEIGDPITYPYPELGLLSPTQIRYAKILTDLIKLFPTLEGKDVLEIGVGNGGLAAQVSTHFKLNSYALVDLDDVLRLTSRTLKPFDHTVDFSFIAPSVEESRATDLLISNYAFSELHKQVQDIYFDKYVRHAKSGYMIYNHIHEDSSISYTANEMCERIPGAMILKELPLTYPGNVLLVWGISELAELKDFS
jgi:predicted RNA methylase